MEDVAFVSERAAGKRKRQDDDDDEARKRVQIKDESLSDDYNSSSSESDHDSDDEQNATVENAMSAVRMSTEPQTVPSVDSLIARIKTRNHPISKRVMRKTYSSPHRTTFVKHMKDAYVEELEIAFRNRQSDYPQHKQDMIERATDAILKRPQDINGYISRLESRCKNFLKKTNPVRQALQGFETHRGKWTIENLVTRINAVRALNKGTDPVEAENNTSHAPGVQGESSRSGGVDQGVAVNTHSMQQEIQALKSSLEQEKKGGREAAQLAQIAQHEKYLHLEQASKIEEELTTTIEKQNLQLKIFKEAEENLTTTIAHRDAEIAALKSTRSGTNSQEALRTAKKAERKAQEAMHTEQAKKEAMFSHYDSAQNKNSVLIGKLTTMAQAGGFGNHGSISQKELDALRARPLTELDEYKEQE